jgi:cysteine desulfurase
MGRLAAEVPELALNVHLELRLPNTLNIRSPRAAGESALAGAPEIGASTGSPCHEGHEMRQR